MSAAAIVHLRAELQSRFDVPLGIRQKTDERLLPTGVAAIDRLTDGGVARGNLTEICGAESSGRTALAISILSEATRGGECCAWIDAAGSFDPASAADAGAILDRLLWVNCGGNAEHALKSCDLLIQAGGFGLVVLDLADTPEAEAHRISLASWFRLRHAAERTGTALVAVEKRINARSCSALQIEMRRKRTIATGKLLAGIEINAESRKYFQLRTADFIAGPRFFLAHNRPSDGLWASPLAHNGRPSGGVYAPDSLGAAAGEKFAELEGGAPRPARSPYSAQRPAAPSGGWGLLRPLR